MDSETDTPEYLGTDNAQPHEDDTPDNLDYYDPEPDTVETDGAEGTDNEDENEAETDIEGEPPVEVEAEGEADEQADTQALVTLADGTQVTHDDLVGGYMRQADYTRKAQEVATQRKSIAEDAKRMESITQTFVDHLSKLVPEAPDARLAYTDAAEYQAQDARYKAAMAQVQQLVELADQPKEIQGKFSEEDAKNMRLEEDRKLTEALPKVATREGRQKFWNEVGEVASAVGFTADEMAGISDHRLFVLADLAKQGLDAQNALKKAKAKAQKAPPVAAQKPGQGARRADVDAKAMRRFKDNPTIRNAAHLDWD